MKKGFLWLGVMTLFCAACDNDDGNKQPFTSTTVNQQSFEVPQIDMDEETFKSELSLRSKFLKPAMVNDPFNHSLEFFIQPSFFVAGFCASVSPNFEPNDDGSFSLSIDYNLNQCSMAAQVPGIVFSVSLRISQLKVVDATGSSVDLTDKTLLDLTGYKVIQAHFKYRELIFASDGVDGLYVLGVKGVFATSDDKKPCIFQAPKIDDCTVGESFIVDLEGNRNALGKKYILQYENAAFSETGNQFQSGLVKFKINRWSGQVVFSGDNEMPTFSASKGSQESAGTLE